MAKRNAGCISPWDCSFPSCVRSGIVRRQENTRRCLCLTELAQESYSPLLGKYRLLWDQSLWFFGMNELRSKESHHLYTYYTADSLFHSQITTDSVRQGPTVHTYILAHVFSKYLWLSSRGIWLETGTKSVGFTINSVLLFFPVPNSGSETRFTYIEKFYHCPV